MSEPILERVRQTLSDVLEIPARDVESATSPETVDSWDSIRHLELILALEQEFGLQFGPDEIERLTSVQAMQDLVGQMLGRSGGA